MSRIAKNPVAIPKGVDVTLNADVISIKGAKGSLSLDRSPLVEIKKDDDALTFSATSKDGHAMSGTTRALVSNMVTGVTQGFERHMQLVGVGYRAQSKGKDLVLNVGYSHPVEFKLPEGITVDLPSQTEIIVKGIDKQLVGQIAANIRSVRPPEPYKGKGIRYKDEVIILKETKKK